MPILYKMMLFENTHTQCKLCCDWIKERTKWKFIPNYGRVNPLGSEHLSAQGTSDPKGGLHCFWCPNKTWIPPITTSSALKIIKTKIELRKLQPPKVEGVNNPKNQTTERYKGWFLNTQKNSLYVALLLLEVNNDL